jgi:hypothetical protein
MRMNRDFSAGRPLGTGGPNPDGTPQTDQMPLPDGFNFRTTSGIASPGRGGWGRNCLSLNQFKRKRALRLGCGWRDRVNNRVCRHCRAPPTKNWLAAPVVAVWYSQLFSVGLKSPSGLFYHFRDQVAVSLLEMVVIFL